MANERDLPLVVYEGLNYYYPWANDRLHTFIIEGVPEKVEAFFAHGIRYVFYLQRNASDPKDAVKQLVKEAALVVTDNYPCFIVPTHNNRLSEFESPVYSVDANCMLPLAAFTREEFAARTIRPKINRLLPDAPRRIVTPAVRKAKPGLAVECPETTVTADEVSTLVSECDIDHSVKPSQLYRGGTAAGRKRLKHFVDQILPHYHETRNEPSIDGSSRLSPYLHFGFLSIQEIVAKVENSGVPKPARDAFLEEAIVRRELSFNLSSRNPHYESLRALPAWALKTMRDHARDPRPELVDAEQLEQAESNDDLWNAAQRELKTTGLLHNYLRMLWGKKVIEWQPTYEMAFELLVHLNNKYALDGRDPNSYAGILWCFGKHDRQWAERETGTLRYMSREVWRGSLEPTITLSGRVEWRIPLGELFWFEAGGLSYFCYAQLNPEEMR